MQHVREQNWFAVGIDLFIVVVGILLALQITNWNEARQDRKDEQRYLAELAANLEADIAQAQSGQQASLSRLAISEAILKGVPSDVDRMPLFATIDRDPTSLGPFENYPYAALTASFYMVSADKIFQELVQTGNTGVITNRTLVKELTTYYERVDRQRGDDGILLGQVDPMMGYLRDNGLGLADRAGMDEAVALAQADKAFLGLVKMAGFLGHWQYSRLVTIEADARTLLAAVQAERGEAP